MTRSIDLNADVGEGCGQDAALMPLISSANIACGVHAGAADSMREAVALARAQAWPWAHIRPFLIASTSAAAR